MTKPGEGDDFYRMNGAGEMLVFSAADFEDFLEPRPDLPPRMEGELDAVVRLLAENRWPFRLHATYDESISRFLDVFEAVNRDMPFDGLRWFFDHAETITDRNLERIKALGGGIAVQHRMAFQGEYFVDRYGAEAAEQTPPIAQDAADGHPGRGGHRRHARRQLQPVGVAVLAGDGQDRRRHCRSTPRRTGSTATEALRLYTRGSAWFSGEEDKKGAIAAGQLADLAVLSADYFSVPEEEIKGIESVLTVVGGKVVYGAGEFAGLAPPPLPVMPDWSPVKAYGGYHQVRQHEAGVTQAPASPTARTACCTASSAGSRGTGRSPCGVAGLRVLRVLTPVTSRNDLGDRLDRHDLLRSAQMIACACLCLFSRRGAAVAILRVNQARVSPSPITGDDTPLFAVNGPGRTGMPRAEHPSQFGSSSWR